MIVWPRSPALGLVTTGLYESGEFGVGHRGTVYVIGIQVDLMSFVAFAHPESAGRDQHHAHQVAVAQAQQGVAGGVAGGQGGIFLVHLAQVLYQGRVLLPQAAQGLGRGDPHPGLPVAQRRQEKVGHLLAARLGQHRPGPLEGEGVGRGAEEGVELGQDFLPRLCLRLQGFAQALSGQQQLVVGLVVGQLDDLLQQGVGVHSGQAHVEQDDLPPGFLPQMSQQLALLAWRFLDEGSRQVLLKGAVGETVAAQPPVHYDTAALLDQGQHLLWSHRAPVLW